MKEDDVKNMFPISSDTGFTMVEIIAVMMIIGIMSAVVLSRIQEDSSGTVSSRDRIKAHIRYAQILALKSNTVCGIDFKGTQYSIFTGNTANTISLGDGPDFTLPVSTRETIYFDLWGTPYSDRGLTTPRPRGPIGSLGLSMTADTGFVQ